MITRKCNFSCFHCLLDCREDDSSLIPDNIIYKIIKEFEEIGGKHIWLTGGEPLTRPDWFKILSFACSRQGFTEVGLQTNAVLIAEEDIRRMLTLPLRKLSLRISLDGASADTHDAVRGSGSFKTVMKVLHMLSATELAGRTSISFTEMRHNFHELPDAVELVSRLGLAGLVSGTIVMSGRCRQYDWIDIPAASQIHNLIDRYCNDVSFRSAYEQVANISAIEWFKGRNVAMEKICTCISNPFVNAEGELYPCVMYLDKSLSVANVHEISLTKAILKGLQKWRKLPLTANERAVKLAECMDCPGHAHCMGGCVGRAAIVNGNPMTAEDRCELRRVVYNLEENQN